MVFAKALASPEVSHEHGEDRSGMKRLLALLIVWTLLVVTGTIMSADARTRSQALSQSQTVTNKNLDRVYR
jgi:hypothetical protein